MAAFCRITSPEGHRGTAGAVAPPHRHQGSFQMPLYGASGFASQFCPSNFSIFRRAKSTPSRQRTLTRGRLAAGRTTPHHSGGKRDGARHVFRTDRFQILQLRRSNETARNEMMQIAFLAADRAVTLGRARKICCDLESDSPAMTAALVGLNSH